MSWLDPLFQGISNLFVNGVQTTKERGLNLIPGTGVAITYADNAAAARTDVTITSTGGGGATPTGTGFYTVVAGVMQAAARAVNLASSDITGILAAANQAAQAMAGDVGGTTAANTVTSLNGGVIGLPTGGVINWSATASPGPTLGQNTTAGATGAIFSVTAQNSSAASGTGGSLNLSAGNGTGATSTGGAVNLSSGNGTTLGNINFQSGNGAYTLTTMNGNTGAWTWGQTAAMSLGQTATTGTAANATIAAQTSTGATSTGGKLLLTPGQGTTKGGDAEVHIYTPTAGTEPYFKVFRNLSGTDTAIAAIGHWPSALAYGTCLWLGQGSAASPTTGNFCIQDYAGSTAINGSGGCSLQYNNTALLTLAGSASIVIAAPVTGDSTQTSVYGVHGDATIAVGTGATVTAAQYANAFFSISSTAAATLNGWPRAAPGQGYSKAFSNTASFPITISDGLHSTIVPANSNHLVWFTSAALALI